MKRLFKRLLSPCPKHGTWFTKWRLCHHCVAEIYIKYKADNAARDRILRGLRERWKR